MICWKRLPPPAFNIVQHLLKKSNGCWSKCWSRLLLALVSTNYNSLAWVYWLPCFVTKGAICSKRSTNCACLFSTANSLKIVWNARRSSRWSKHGWHKPLRFTTTGSYSSINTIDTIISFLIDPNQSELHYPWPPSCFFSQWKSAKNSGRCLWLAEMLILLHERVAQQCTRRDIASLQSFVPCNMSHKVQQVELRATCRGDKIVARFVLHESKSMNSHEGTCRCNMSLGHVPATFSCVCGCCDFVPATCPCYASLLNIKLVYQLCVD